MGTEEVVEGYFVLQMDSTFSLLLLDERKGGGQDQKQTNKKVKKAKKQKTNKKETKLLRIQLMHNSVSLSRSGVKSQWCLEPLRFTFG